MKDVIKCVKSVKLLNANLLIKLTVMELNVMEMLIKRHGNVIIYCFIKMIDIKTADLTFDCFFAI